MKKRANLIGMTIILTCFLPFSMSLAFDTVLHGNVPAEVYFSPDGGATAAILKLMATAGSEILIQAYSFRSPSITGTLIDAHKKGVKVKLIIDKSERMEGVTSATLLDSAGIPVYLDGKHAIANNRVIIIDRQIVMTGSFNFNAASEELNAENLLILKSKELAALYRDNWFAHQKHSEPFSAAAK